MALSTQIRIYAALGLLIATSGGVYVAMQNEKKEEQKYTSAGQSGSLPDIKLAAEDIEKLTKLEIKNTDKSEVVLEKKGESWVVTKPVSYPANQQNVKSLLDNLKELKVKESIDKSPSSYGDYSVDDVKAVHVIASKADGKALDLYFGKSGGRGQMARKAGVDGVFAVTGYSSFLYAREVKNWRDTSIAKFDSALATQVDLKNDHGDFLFKKDGETWTGTFKGKKIDRYDDSKIKDLLNAYKALNADDFGDGSLADAGLDKPVSTVAVSFKEGPPVKFTVGKTSTGENRYLQKDGTGQVFVVSSWAAGWATSDVEKFQKPDDKKPATDAEKKDDHKH